MIRSDSQKMSKSAGNLVFVADLRRDWDPIAIRLALIDGHYRADRDWDQGALDAAAERLARWRAQGAGDAALDEVRAALDDDLDTPRAVAAVDAAVDRGLGVSSAAALLGVT